MQLPRSRGLPGGFYLFILNLFPKITSKSLTGAPVNRGAASQMYNSPVRYLKHLIYILQTNKSNNTLKTLEIILSDSNQKSSILYLKHLICILQTNIKSPHHIFEKLAFQLTLTLNRVTVAKNCQFSQIFIGIIDTS